MAARDSEKKLDAMHDRLIDKEARAAQVSIVRLFDCVPMRVLKSHFEQVQMSVCPSCVS